MSKEIEFDAGHRVPNHRSKCRNPHGHRYRVEVLVEGPLGDDEGSSSEGMVVDFGDLKTLLARVHDAYDHGFVVYRDDTEMLTRLSGANWKVVEVDFIPTAENFARAIHEALTESLEWPGCVVQRVKVWETPTSVATYTA